MRYLLLFFFLFSLNPAEGFSSQGVHSSGEGNDSLPTKIHYQAIQIKIGFNLGYRFPYSAGIELSCLINELVDVNIGGGLGMGGAKVGFGSRIFPVRKKKFSPFFGLYFYYATGLWDMKVTNNTNRNESAIYRITPDYALLASVGLRKRFGKGQYLIVGVGYAFPYFGRKAEYISGSDLPELKKSMDAYATGGISLNIGLLIKLNRGNYQK